MYGSMCMCECRKTECPLRCGDGVLSGRVHLATSGRRVKPRVTAPLSWGVTVSLNLLPLNRIHTHSTNIKNKPCCPTGTVSWAPKSI